MFLSFIIVILYLFFPIKLTSASSDDNSASADDPVCVILFMFFGLCSGIIIMQLLSRFGEAIPYTVVIFILGVVSSGISNVHGGGVLADSIADWVKIDADLIVFIFLPPLVFGEAMNLKWHHVQSAFFPASLLAGPGVLIGAVLMGVFVKYVIPYNWDWNLSMCFGSTVAATDTVAVVSLLHSAGASQKLTMLIAGESLMNDGTAMTLFILFYHMLEGISYSYTDILVFAISSILLSAVIGIFAGLLIVYWLRSANRPLREDDVFIQISITLCATYLIFFLAQYVLRISGVLACCASGVMLAWLAPPIILSRESMHNVWAIVEWMGNTLIFLLAGLIIGHRTLEHVSAIDWLYTFILYIMVMLIRVVTIAILFPWLKFNNHHCTVKEAVFIAWAGLRGALSIALAMIVENNTSLDVSSKETSRMLFYVGGIAALSLLLNATLARKVLDYFELIDDCTIEKELVMTAIKKRLRKRMNKVLEQVAGDLPPEELDEVRMSCSLLKGEHAEHDIYGHNREQTFLSSPNRLFLQSPRNSIRVASQSSIDIPTSLMPAYHPVSLSEPNNKPSTPSVAERVGLDFFRPGSTNMPTTAAGAVRSHSIFATSQNASRFDQLHSRLADVSRLLSQDRGAYAVLSPDLLAYVRGIFLEIVRVKYWQHIDRGKLPRLSHSAQYLLYSVDVGLDEVRNIDGLQDWPSLEQHVVSKSWFIRIFMLLDSILPHWTCLKFIPRTLGKLEATRDKRNYYMLTSFIEAHEHAQRKMHSFLGIEEDEDSSDPSSQQRSSSVDDQASNGTTSCLSPEEIRVKSESEEAVGV
jgi:NhaP-type Na+/H+ or K+/H+ antiporter